jgi:hypothetical protein
LPKIDLGVTGCGVETLMAQQIGDVLEIDPG